MNLNNVMIGTEDAPRLAAFYTKLFGEPAWSDNDYTGWVLGNGSITVAPHSEVKGPNATPGRLILNLESNDVLADFAKLQAAGARVVKEPYTFDEAPGTWVATLADPDDNYFQLVSPMGTEAGGGPA